MPSAARNAVLFALTTMLGAGSALADSVSLTTVVDLHVGQSTETIVVTGDVGFNPGTNKLSFRVGNRQCTFNSSGNPWGAGGGQGCNYALTYNASTGAITYMTSNGAGCTEPHELANACSWSVSPP